MFVFGFRAQGVDGAPGHLCRRPGLEAPLKIVTVFRYALLMFQNASTLERSTPEMLLRHRNGCTN